MFNYASCFKRFACVVIFFLLIFNISFKTSTLVCVAQDSLENELSDNIDSILDDVDFSGLDESVYSVPNLNLSFKDFVKDILSGENGFNYNSLFEYIKNNISNQFKINLRFFVSLFIIVFLYEIFKSFSENKSSNLSSALKIIFSFLLATLVLFFVKEFIVEIQMLVDDLFSFSGKLFPILISFLALAGASKSVTVFSSFSVFLLETGSYLIKYLLLPLAVSILFLSLFGSIFSKGNFSKLISFCKSIFKYVIAIFFALFGLISTVNVISTTTRDGINLKITKFALKNYIPVLGGYVSEGFDFIYSCSILIKNAVGVCSIIIIIFKILMPVLMIIAISLSFKFLAVITGLVGDGSFSNMFDDVSKAFSNFLSVIVGLFLIMFIFIFLVILSVGVVWFDRTCCFYYCAKYYFWIHSNCLSV